MASGGGDEKRDRHFDPMFRPPYGRRKLDTDSYFGSLQALPHPLQSHSRHVDDGHFEVKDSDHSETRRGRVRGRGRGGERGRGRGSWRGRGGGRGGEIRKWGERNRGIGGKEEQREEEHEEKAWEGSGGKRGERRGRGGTRGRGGARGSGRGRGGAIRSQHGDGDLPSTDLLDQPTDKKRGEPSDKDKSWLENIHSFSVGDIMALSRMPPHKLLENLSGRVKGFQCTLQYKKTLERPGIMNAILTILFRIANSIEHGDSRNMACQILAEALSERCAVFLFQLKLYIAGELGRSSHSDFDSRSPRSKIQLVIDLFRRLLLYLPGSSWSCLPVDELKQSVEQLPIHISASFFDSLESIVALRDSTREQHSIQRKKQENAEEQWDNSEYKTIEILPQWNEVCVPQKPRLRKNIISGSYTDWLHYYDVQFRLLREDFIAPLRSGVCEYLGGVRGRKLRNVRVYNNVLIKEPELLPSGLCYKIKLDFSHLCRRMNWEHSKRLLHGSLLCLSPTNDNFTDQMYFATVVKRDPKEIAEGELVVMFKKDERMLSFSCTDVPFTMVESCAYFEASQHILRSLQTAEIETMPFTKYLIEGECTSVDQPKYLKKSQSAYDLTCILTEDEKFLIMLDGLSSMGTQTAMESEAVSDESDSGSQESYYDSASDSSDAIITTYPVVPPVSKKGLLVHHIEDLKYWPSSEETELDNSQLQGLHMALTQEIAVIQGPPGTGKTYIGLKIVEALQMNPNIYSSGDEAKSPIFVMCLTNHALDQFLEGILDSPLYKGKPHDEVKLVRIGGRCQSEKLSDFNLNSKRGNTHLPGKVRHDKYEAEQAVRNKSKMGCSHAQAYFTAMKSHEIFSLNDLESFIPPHHYSMLFHFVQTPEQKAYALELWLGLVQVVGIPATNQRSDAEAIENQSASETNFLVVQSSQLKSQVNNGVEKQNSEPVEEPGKEEADKSSESKKSRESSSDEDSDSESYVDIEGEAMIEQSGRLLDDADQQPLRSIKVDYEKANRDYLQRMMSVGSEQNNIGHMPTQQPVKLYFDHDRAQEVLERGFSVLPMTEDESLGVINVYELNMTNRWRLFLFWRSRYLNYLREKCEEEFVEYNRLCTVQDEARKKADRFSLESAQIIGMTTTGAAKYQHILHLVKPRIVIVEEAAEVLESHIVSALNAGTQHLILIGDHKQLRPKPNEYELAKKYNLDISLFERLIRNGFPHATLEYQHRMRPEIAQLVKPHIYSLLSNHPSVEDYPDVRGAGTNLFFIKHDFEEKEDEHLMSHSNDHEASFLVSLCRYFLQQRYTPDQITILVTYSGQLLAMRRLMPKAEFNGVIIRTVDNFQGEENDIILLSLVRSNTEGNVGFLKEENRVCVALSRARQGFYCIGNFDMLREKVPLWESIITDMEQKGKVGDGLLLHCSNHPEANFTAKAAKDFEKYAPKGGCLKDCSFRLECGHVCAQKCHYINPEHSGYKCIKKCSKSCPEGHPCRRLCYVECKCVVRVTRIIPQCEHEQEMFCHQDPAQINCNNPCKKKCSKQRHTCPLLCHQACQPCQVRVSIIMPSCQHEQWVECHLNPNSVLCRAECNQQCKHGHKCSKLCHEDCGDCLVPIEKSIPECGHKVLLPCSVEPNHSECTKPCEKTLPCGHKCKLRCGKDCRSSPCKYHVSKELPSCGHRVKVECFMSEFLEMISCKEKCERLLPCGHPCGKKCSDPCKTECNQKVNKVWPCGHKLQRPCYQIEAPENYPCHKKCEKLLECGHPCSKECGQPCDDKCEHSVQKTYPCGHIFDAPCFSTPSEFPCKLLCSYILACGHKCSGTCSQCVTKHMHEPCSFKIGLKRFCGHSFQTPCSGLRDSHPGKKDITVLCSHEITTKKCSEEKLHACEKICEWNCAHFNCSKPCIEMCDRSKCDERCPRKLKCGHRCHGLCGEPCLSLCPECHPETFLKKLKRADEFSKGCLYYELPCKHIFQVQYLDEYVRQFSDPQSHILVCPLQCPVKECSKPLSCSYRYGNAAKQFLRYVQNVSIDLTRDIYHDHELSDRIQKIIESKHCTVSGPDFGRRHRKVLFTTYFKPMPAISNTFDKLKSFTPRHSEEQYLVLLFLKGVDVLTLIQESSTSLSSIADYDATVESVKSFLQFGSNLISQEFKLALQTIIDLRRELLCLFLCALILLAKAHRESLSHYQSLLLSKAESFLKEANSSKALLDESALLHHLKALSKVTHSSAYEELIGILDVYYPKFKKGKWWRCPRGHYYCSPLTLLEDVKLKCPRCEGSYANFIQLPDQEKIKPLLPAATPFIEVKDAKPQPEFDSGFEPHFKGSASHRGGQHGKRGGQQGGGYGRGGKKGGKRGGGRGAG